MRKIAMVMLLKLLDCRLLGREELMKANEPISLQNWMDGYDAVAAWDSDRSSIRFTGITSDSGSEESLSFNYLYHVSEIFPMLKWEKHKDDYKATAWSEHAFDPFYSQKDFFVNKKGELVIVYEASEIKFIFSSMEEAMKVCQDVEDMQARARRKNDTNKS